MVATRSSVCKLAGCLQVVSKPSDAFRPHLYLSFSNKRTGATGFASGLTGLYKSEPVLAEPVRPGRYRYSAPRIFIRPRIKDFASSFHFSCTVGT